MFFALSKLLAFLLKPLIWAVLLAVAAWLTRRPERRRHLLAWSTFVLLVFSNPWLANQAARFWETTPINPAQMGGPYDVGIVLGGYLDVDALRPEGLLSLNRSGIRIVTALELYRVGKIKHILLTGGSGRLIGKAEDEAPLAADFLRRVGVPDSAIIVESRSRNTLENALFSKEILDRQLPGAKCLLISSAWHLPRAGACFKKAGLPCVEFGTDYLSTTKGGNRWKWLEPDWRAWLYWELLLKEWVGYATYGITGKL